MDPLYDKLIYDLVATGQVNPNRVYLMGYSAGGDGVYQLAPRMADRFAAAAMMAGHPNDSSPLGLRNIAFAIYAGGDDKAYMRNCKAGEWEGMLNILELLTGAYPHRVQIYKDTGHWMNHRDREALEWLARFSRNPLPNEITWCQGSVFHSRFYWLAADKQNAQKYDVVHAKRQGQHISLASSRPFPVRVRLNDQMLDLDQPIAISGPGFHPFQGPVNRTIATMAATLAERSDPAGIFSAQIELLPNHNAHDPTIPPARLTEERLHQILGPLN
jgi:hypothetical protein